MSGIINVKLKEKTSGALGLNGIANVNVGAPMPFVIPDPLPKFIPTGMGSINLNYTTEKYNLFFSADGGMRSRGSHGHSDIERQMGRPTWTYDSIDQYNRNRNFMGSIKAGMEYYINDKNSVLFSYQLRGGNRRRLSQIFSNDIRPGYDGYLDYTQLDTNNNRNINQSFNLSYIKKFDEKDRELTVDATFSMRHVQGDGFQSQLYSDTLANYDHYYLRESETENFHNALNLKANYVHPFAGTWKLETGYEGRMDWPDQNAIYYRTEYDAITHLMNPRYHDELSSTHFDYNQQTHGVYATVGGKITDKLSGQAGLRVEYSYFPMCYVNR